MPPSQTTPQAVSCPSPLRLRSASSVRVSEVTHRVSDPWQLAGAQGPALTAPYARGPGVRNAKQNTGSPGTGTEAFTTAHPCVAVFDLACSPDRTLARSEIMAM